MKNHVDGEGNLEKWLPSRNYVTKPLAAAMFLAGGRKVPRKLDSGAESDAK